MTYDPQAPQPTQPNRQAKSPTTWVVGAVIAVLVVGLAFWGVFGSGPTANNQTSTVTPNTTTGTAPK